MKEEPAKKLCVICGEEYQRASGKTSSNKFGNTCDTCKVAINSDKIKLKKRTLVDWIKSVGAIESPSIRGWVWCVVWWDWLADSHADELRRYPHNHYVVENYSFDRLYHGLMEVGYCHVHASHRSRGDSWARAKEAA